jgi:predicted RNase H-like HicB family nuclease
MKHLTATISRDESGSWIAHVNEEPRAHTFGRTVPKALEHLHEAAALWFDVDPDEIHIDELHLDLANRSIDVCVQRALVARNDLEVAQRAAAEATVEAAHLLLNEGGASIRDTAAILGISHQRIHQLVEGARPAKAKARPKPKNKPRAKVRG